MDLSWIYYIWNMQFSCWQQQWAYVIKIIMQPFLSVLMNCFKVLPTPCSRNTINYDTSIIDNEHHLCQRTFGILNF